jgi:hypothetical protein
MRKSGHKAGGVEDGPDWGEEEGEAKEESGRAGRRRRPKRCSHSGPERYVMVAISVSDGVS